MSDNELRDIFDRAVLAAERRSLIAGRLGRINADGTVTLEVPTRTNWLYVGVGVDGTQGWTPARNDAGVPHRAFLPVAMQRADDGALAIVGINNSGGLADATLAQSIYGQYGVPAHLHDFLGLTDTPAAYTSQAGKLTQVNAGEDAIEFVEVGAKIAAATSKATPVDADNLALSDSAASNVLKRLTWANLKATLKTYFDGLYLILAGKAGGQTAYGGTASGNNLTLRSTSHATKGQVIVSDDLSALAHILLGNGNSKTIKAEDSGGTARIVLYMSTDDDLILGFGVQAGEYVGIAPGGSTKLAVLADGNVGIGTTSPRGRFDVRDTYGNTLKKTISAVNNTLQVVIGAGVVQDRVRGTLICVITGGTGTETSELVEVDLEVPTSGGSGNTQTVTIAAHVWTLKMEDKSTTTDAQRLTIQRTTGSTYTLDCSFWLHYA